MSADDEMDPVERAFLLEAEAEAEAKAASAAVDSLRFPTAPGTPTTPGRRNDRSKLNSGSHRARSGPGRRPDSPGAHA